MAAQSRGWRPLSALMLRIATRDTGPRSLGDNRGVRIRNFALPLCLGVLALAQQGDWRTANELPGVDTQGLSPARRAAAFKFLREESCTCGCTMKLAECRMKDPSCAYSRKLSSVVTKGFAAGKSNS